RKQALAAGNRYGSRRSNGRRRPFVAGDVPFWHLEKASLRAARSQGRQAFLPGRTKTRLAFRARLHLWSGAMAEAGIGRCRRHSARPIEFRSRPDRDRDATARIILIFVIDAVRGNAPLGEQTSLDAANQ